MADSPKLDITYLEEGQASAEVTVNDGTNRLDALVFLSIEDRNLTAPPGGENDGEVWLVAAGGTGTFLGHDGEFGIYSSGYTFVAPSEGWVMWVKDEDVLLYYDGAAWKNVMIHTLFDAHTILAATADNTPVALTIAEQRVLGRITSGNITALTAANLYSILNDTHSLRKVTAGITAGTTQSQGQVPLVSDINEVSVCANVNDVVTMPSATAGLEIFIRNNGAQTLQIFPASGDDINKTGVDSSVTLAVGASVRYVAIDAVNWYS
jgi:hypothetical protein